MRATRIVAAGLVFSICIPGVRPLSALIQGEERPWPTFDDLLHLRQIDEIAVSPDGLWLAYVSRPVFESGQSSEEGRITFVNLRNRATRVAEVPYSPRNLKWSPRGRLLAFQIQSAHRTELWQFAPSESAGRAQPLLSAQNARGDILDYSWSPTGDSIAYLGAEPRTSTTLRDSTRLSERLVLFSDTPGNLAGSTASVWGKDSLGAYISVFAPGEQEPRLIRRQVISQKGDPQLQWLRAGHIGVIGVAPKASLDQLFFERSVIVVEPRSGSARPLSIGARNAPRLPAWSPSGHQLAFLNLDRPGPDPCRPLIVYSLRVMHRSAEVAKPVLSTEADGLWHPLGPIWSADERTLYIARYQRGSARLFAVDVKSGSWKAITADSMSVSHYVLANDGKHLVVAMESANQPRDIYSLDPASLAVTRLTHEGEALSRYPQGRVDNVEWPSADGRFMVHGFLVRPPGYVRGRRYPLIVMVHGGPGDFYTNSFMRVRFETRAAPPQMLAAAGYMVLLPNPRGDSSYGEQFQVALNGDLAAGPFHDVDSGVSALIARGLADSTSIGIYGVSYGGYLTAYAITQTRRYAAAALDDGPINLASLFGQSYALQPMYLRARLGGTPWTRPGAYASQSPITFVHQVRTPVLMRYGGRSASAADAIRFSFLAQGLEFYAGLKESNVPVEFVLHPDQGHGIADWQLFRDWNARTLSWFRRWMPPPGAD